MVFVISCSSPVVHGRVKVPARQLAARSFNCLSASSSPTARIVMSGANEMDMLPSECRVAEQAHAPTAASAPHAISPNRLRIAFIVDSF
jgi:hypothetical protein